MAISMRKAINEKCKDCIYDPLSGLGTWRKQVTGCTSPDCALFPFRPLSDDSDELKVRQAEWKERYPNRLPPGVASKGHPAGLQHDPLP